MKQRRLTHKEKSELFAKYETGKYTGADLAKEYPISCTAINALLRRNGYKAKSQSELQRKYPIKENFFDVIDNEQKAYILGLLYADGCNNTKRNSVMLSLKEDDKYVLDYITQLIQPTKPLRHICNSKQRKRDGFENSKDSWQLYIANKHISQRLIELGCGKAKTHNLKFPTEKQVPKHLQRHFIRGYFDGDGSVSAGKRCKVNIIGTIDFIKKIQIIMFDELSFAPTKLTDRWKERETNIRSLGISGRKQCISFRDWLYKDATIFIERKKKIFDSYKPFIRIERKCSAEGCEIKHFGKGYCRNHYYQFCGGKEKRIQRNDVKGS